MRLIRFGLLVVLYCRSLKLSASAFSSKTQHRGYHSNACTAGAIGTGTTTTTCLHQCGPGPSDKDDNADGEEGVRRRSFVVGLTFAMAGLFQPMHAANAVMENSQKVFVVGKTLSEEDAVARFKEGRASIQYLLDNFGTISKGGGDNVRRYLGTVGTTSGLYGIKSVMKVLAERADDLVEYTETATEVERCIQQADGSAYMAIFTTTSSSPVPPEKYFADAKTEVKRCIQALDELASMISI